MVESGSCYRFREIIKVIAASFHLAVLKIIFCQLIFEIYEYLFTLLKVYSNARLIDPKTVIFESVYRNFLLSDNNALPYFTSSGESQLLIFIWVLVLSFLLGREIKLYILIYQFSPYG